jgi:uncharacterized protein
MARTDRGFASLDLNKRREISSKGGQAAHRQGKAHEWTREEAREAGRKGGMASHRHRAENNEEKNASERDMTAAQPDRGYTGEPGYNMVPRSGQPDVSEFKSGDRTDPGRG